jgi:hypothetical protein
MSKLRCPGQDTRFRRPDDITEVACDACGATIEFFQDDETRDCPGCGRRVANPQASPGDAEPSE